MKSTLLGAASLTLCLCSAAQAEGWHYNGFINQTLINTSNNFMFGKTDDAVSLDYRELALIVNGTLLPQVDFSSQLLSRKAGTADDGSPRVDYAFLSWRFHEDFSTSHGFRLGRLKAPIGFYNDSRDSPFTRNGIFLPQSIYLDRARNYIMRADELMYLGEWRNDQWTLNWKIAGGYNIPDGDEITDMFNVPERANPSFEHARSWHFQVMADYDAGRIRFGYSEYDSPNHYQITILSPPIGEVKSNAGSRWRVLSFEYNDVLWGVTAEYERATFTFNGVSPNPFDPGYRDYPEGGYLQFNWNLSAKQSLFFRKDFLYFNRNDKNGEVYSQLMLPKFSGTIPIDRFGRANVVGWSYRPAPEWLIRLDVSKNSGVLMTTQRDAPSGYVAKRDWNMAALAVSWRF
ncbi:MAG TPA: hypothetical protein VFM46_17110 [Pseudomonadales bacterium]|nr:hypothetical protein [Pseudomonadales bacterium]